MQWMDDTTLPSHGLWLLHARGRPNPGPFVGPPMIYSITLSARRTSPAGISWPCLGGALLKSLPSTTTVGTRTHTRGGRYKPFLPPIASVCFFPPLKGMRNFHCVFPYLLLPLSSLSSLSWEGYGKGGEGSEESERDLLPLGFSGLGFPDGQLVPPRGQRPATVFATLDLGAGDLR
jgi:hypothetical protein